MSAVIDQELEALITPIGLTQKRSYMDRQNAKTKKSPITQLFNNGDLDGSVLQSGRLSDSDNTTKNDEEDSRHQHSRNQGKRKNMYDGI